METFKLQMDVKNNAQDLQNYMLDLKNWEEEMKKKDIALNKEKPQQSNVPPPRNQVRSKLNDERNHFNKPKKISAYDYLAWDKFDADKACAALDEEENVEEKSQEKKMHEKNSPNNKEKVRDDMKNNKNLTLIDEAFYEKELGNQFVKKTQWSEAIKCYTNAINLDSNNAIYYANRSLCFLKLKNFKAAETDATAAIQMDKNYIKAYQRRALARLELGQLTEAKFDYLQILTLEPKNTLAAFQINKIDEKLNKNQEIIKLVKPTFEHKNIFKNDSKPLVCQKQSATLKTVGSSISQTLPFNQVSQTDNAYLEKKVDNTRRDDYNKNNNNFTSKTQIFKKQDDDIHIPIHSSTMSEVFEPLPEWCKIVHPVQIPPHKRSKKPLKRIEIAINEKEKDNGFAGNNINVCEIPCERKGVKKTVNKPDHNIEIRNEKLSFEVPKTAIQFCNCWKIVKENPEECYSFIKKIPAKELVHIFENSLESEFFSELITFLANDDIKKEPEVVYDFLLGLSQVKRFSTLIMFLSQADKTCIKKSISELEKFKSKEDISRLLRLYEINA